MIEPPHLPNAACANHPHPDEAFFPSRHQARNAEGRRIIHEARQLCGRCPEQLPCLTWALEHSEHGIWGGTDETERERMAPRPLTQEMRRRGVRRMTREGATDTQIAATLNVSRGAVYNDRLALNIPANKTTPEGRRQDVADLHTAGLTDRQVGEELGINRSTARLHRVALGLPANQQPA